MKTDNAVKEISDLIERGERAPSLSQIIMAIREYNVNPTWLFKGEGEMFCRNNPVDEIFESKKTNSVHYPYKRHIDKALD
jgi:hypothetical protein